MKRILLASAAIICLSSAAAHADTFTDAIVNNLQSLNYTTIQIVDAGAQVKVEAVRGTETLEVIYDRATGGILRQEAGTVDAGTDTTPGVQVTTASSNDTTGTTGTTGTSGNTELVATGTGDDSGTKGGTQSGSDDGSSSSSSSHDSSSNGGSATSLSADSNSGSDDGVNDSSSNDSSSNDSSSNDSGNDD